MTKPLNILYLHGLGSSGNATTALGLKEIGFNVTAPTYRPEHFSESMQRLNQLLTTQSFDCIVGTSLGAYYILQIASQFNGPAIAINSCFEPKAVFNKYLTEPPINYQDNRIIEINPLMLEAFKTVTMLEGVKIVIGENDDVIPADYQKAFCKQLNKTWTSTNWGHRVEEVNVLGALIRASVD
ncbi:MAG: hypothetical protein ISEC1_P0197 [Thiomicrorhabdus sp.]|nr:MAG: hypothetical protein ISEC1_P0197 [Thiomicrorhabdus sp.]